VSKFKYLVDLFPLSIEPPPTKALKRQRMVAPAGDGSVRRATDASTALLAVAALSVACVMLALGRSDSRLPVLAQVCSPRRP
jgi:hypothetical protein